MSEQISQSLPESPEADQAIRNLWKARKKFISYSVLILVLSIVLSLIWPKTFQASTTILPDLDFLNGVGNLGGFKDLAAAAGLNLNMAVTSPSQLYPDIIYSEGLLSKVIFKKYKSKDFDTLVTLMQYYGFDSDDPSENFEKCIKKMRESVLDIDVDKKTLILTVSATTPEQQLSADIANATAQELDNFQRLFRRTNASQQREFLEGRLDDVKKALSIAEDRLKEFREKNRAVQQSPQLQLEESRRSREVDLNSSLFLQLVGQYESAKLDEIKNTPVVQVLDSARAPWKKRSPKRMIMVAILTLFGSGIVGAWYAGGKDFYRHVKQTGPWTDRDGTAEVLAEIDSHDPEA